MTVTQRDLFGLIIQIGTTHHFVYHVYGFYIEDDWVVVQRHLGDRLTECIYPKECLVGGCKKDEFME